MTSPVRQPLQPGQRVQVCFDRFAGQRGTVVSVTQSGTLVVRLDRERCSLSFGSNEVVRIDGY